MSKLFSGYYRPDEDEFRILWESGVFILDTNVLLDLYRYPKELREELVGVLGKLSEQLWLPHQVFLEYQ